MQGTVGGTVLSLEALVDRAHGQPPLNCPFPHPLLPLESPGLLLLTQAVPLSRLAFIQTSSDLSS